MMKKRKSVGILLLLVFAACSVAAQRRRHAMPVREPKPKPVPQKQAVQIPRNDTTIKSTTLEVYQQYEPELKPITKPELSATLPPQPATRAAQQYDVPQQTLYYSYRALPLRPLALGKDTAAPPPSNYAMLAGGNLATILGEFGIGSLHGSNWQSAIQGRYITQEGDLEGQVFRSLQLKGTGTLRQSGHLWEAGADVQRDVFGAYGYNHDLVQHSFDDVRRVLTSATINLGAANETAAAWGIFYHPSISATYFTATAIDHETSFRLEVPVSKQIDSNLSAGIGVNARITKTDLLQDSRNNNILQFTPAVQYRKGGFTGHLGLYPTIESAKTELLPDIHAELKISNTNLIISAGWLATLRQNTAQQLFTTNPYLASTLGIFGYQTHQDDVFAGLAFGLGRHLSLWGRGGWQQFNNLPLFVTRYMSDGKDYVVQYDPQVQAIVWSAGINYAIGKDFTVSGAGTWYNYYKHTYDHVWGEPSVRLKGNASWRPVQALNVSAYLEVMDHIWGLDAQQNAQKLSGVFELGASAEYSIIQRLNLFLHTENLLGRKNERWLGYPSFGFNIYGGVRFLF